ncbi:hypothetical protein AVEN_118553-1 [Araneus ventricosus]|uniref:Uncharacterized protein n=1 Tax=Araneus ventricosus TaxID=182803 RepID=A0A4Y2AX74_ARAVE|nr:hypothetical protein AVEN_118553-1 [Araneus ventricosus]
MSIKRRLCKDFDFWFRFKIVIDLMVLLLGKSAASLTPLKHLKGRGGLVVRSWPWAGGLQVQNPITVKILRVLGLLHAKSYLGVKSPSVGVMRKFGEVGGCRASSSSPERGIKL